MKLYEINAEILRLTDAIEFDEETGEILGDADELFTQIQSLQMEKKSILEYLAKLVLNIRAEAAAAKTEEQRLKARRDRLAKKEDRLMKILDRECAGEKTDLGVATFAYRKTSPCGCVGRGKSDPLAQAQQAPRLFPHPGAGSRKGRGQEAHQRRNEGARLRRGRGLLLLTQIRRI